MACFAVVAAFLAVLLREQKPELALALSVAVGLIVLGALTKELRTVIEGIRSLLSGASLSWEYGKTVFKAMGICLITQLSADACRDAGERAMAEKVELAGKLSLMVLALPLFEKIAQLSAALMSGEALGG